MCAYVWDTHTFEVENLELAEKCYERALELDPKNLDALTSLAMMKMANEKDGRDSEIVKNNVNALFNAHCHNPNLAVTLNGLAFHFFHKMRYNKVIELGARVPSNGHRMMTSKGVHTC